MNPIDQLVKALEDLGWTVRADVKTDGSLDADISLASTATGHYSGFIHVRNGARTSGAGGHATPMGEPPATKT